MSYRFFVSFFLLMGSFSLVYSLSDRLPEKSISSTEVSEEDPFTVMMKVLMHKRCVNCHPNGDRPRQGEDSHYHNFGVVRGPDNHGLEGLSCETCHQSENNDYSGVPGAPEWSLAPIEMYWEGLNRTEIAESMLDPKKERWSQSGRAGRTPYRARTGTMGLGARSEQ
jgi:hypothetical protein